VSIDSAYAARASVLWLRLPALALATGLGFACGDGPFGLDSGTLRVQWVTTGGDVDLDGYLLAVDQAAPEAVAISGTRRIESLVGNHSVALSGLASNCTVVGDNPRAATVQAGATTDVTLEVACVATGLWVAVSTAGLDLPGSFSLTVDAGPSISMPANSSASISRLSPGTHSVSLGGLASNCTVANANPRDVTLASGETAIVAFSVSCRAKSADIAVTAATTGSDLPTRDYTIRVDGTAMGGLVNNGTRVITGAAPGDHAVELADVPFNCTVAGANPVTVTLTAGEVTRDTADVVFDVACVTSGSISVTAVTRGFDGPRSGYPLRLNGAAADTVRRGGSKVIDRVLPGDHTIELTGVPSNCTVIGVNPVTVAVTSGGMTRDTADVAFEIDCARVWGLAFTRSTAGDLGEAPAVHAARVDGSDAAFVAWGRSGEWSPDGRRIVLEACAWSSYYYYYYGYSAGCVPSGLSIVDMDSDAVTALTSDATDGDPAWRPDGATIAFSRRERLVLMAAAGGIDILVPLPSTVKVASHPAWSPDGSTLAFTCELTAGNADICLVRPDGTGFLRLTDAPGREARPSWRPDGTSIAFASTSSGGVSEVVLVAPDGHELARLSPGVGAIHPVWSTDGTAIAFAGVTCNIYSGCRGQGLFRMSADGTGVTRLTTEASDDAPAWRP
jgi:hypothetical protein